MKQKAALDSEATTKLLVAVRFLGLNSLRCWKRDLQLRAGAEFRGFTGLGCGICGRKREAYGVKCQVSSNE